MLRSSSALGGANLLQSEDILDERMIRRIARGLARNRREVVAVLYLSTERRVIAMRHVAAGSRNSVALPARAIIRDMLALNATRVVLAHNHPSGDCRPSVADRMATRRLIDILRPLGMQLEDHFVIARGARCSFRALGLL
jgi:DNA repair protein RadC